VAGRVLDSFADVLVACLALGLVLLAQNTWHSHVDMTHIKETVFKKLINNEIVKNSYKLSNDYLIFAFGYFYVRQCSKFRGKTV
jgi:hypothetical protein